MARIINNDIARFWSKVDKKGPLPKHKPELGPCWTWLGSFDGGGYAIFYARKTMKCSTAHVFSCALHHGPIPTGYDVDHLCRNHGCPNPAHLEAVTHRENMLRGETFPAWHAKQTHCLRGHPFTPENTYVNTRGERQCRQCAALRQSKQWQPVRTGNYRGYSGPRKLTHDQVVQIHLRYRAGEERDPLCSEFGISYSLIEKILRGLRWPEVLEELNWADTSKFQEARKTLSQPEFSMDAA